MVAFGVCGLRAGGEKTLVGRAVWLFNCLFRVNHVSTFFPFSIFTGVGVGVISCVLARKKDWRWGRVEKRSILPTTLSRKKSFQSKNSSQRCTYSIYHTLKLSGFFCLPLIPITQQSLSSVWHQLGERGNSKKRKLVLIFFCGELAAARVVFFRGGDSARNKKLNLRDDDGRYWEKLFWLVGPIMTNQMKRGCVCMVTRQKNKKSRLSSQTDSHLTSRLMVLDWPSPIWFFARHLKTDKK